MRERFIRGLFCGMIGIIFFFPWLLQADSTQKKSLTLGFMPYLSATVLLEKYTPLAHYLSEELGQNVRIVVAKDYAQHIQNTGEDKLDISFLGGSPYVVIGDRYGKKPLLVRYEFEGQPTFRSVIFVAKNSPLKSLAELSGKKMAFGNPNSTLSTQVPLYMLLQEGVALDMLQKYEHMRNHENVVYSVIYGDFDAGAVAEEIFKEKKEQVGIRALAYSPPLSTHVFVTRSDMKVELQKKIQQALLQLKASKKHQNVLRAISEKLTGFVLAHDSDYDYHRDMLKSILPILNRD